MDISGGSPRDQNFSHRHIQSVLFPKKYTQEAVKQWLNMKGFKSDDVKLEKNFIHSRQYNPVKGSKNRIFKLPDSDIEYVLEFSGEK